MTDCVLDSSCVMAYIYREKGWENVEEYLPECFISAVNFSEMLGRVAEQKRYDPARLHGWFNILPFDEDLAVIAAELKPQTIKHGISLADRACMATAIKLNLPIVTADKIWKEIKLPVKVIIIR